MEKCRRIEEAAVYVKEFLTMKVLEDTPAVLSLRKLCEERGYSYEWINSQKPHLIKNGIRIQSNTENFVPIVVPGLSTSSSSSLPSSTSHDTFKAGNWSSYVFLKLVYLTNHDIFKCVKRQCDKTSTGDLCGIDSYPVTVSSKHVERQERGDLLTKPTKNPKPNKNEDHDLERGDLLNSDLLQEFRENLVDDRVPEHRDSHASSSHEPSLEPATSADLG